MLKVLTSHMDLWTGIVFVDGRQKQPHVTHTPATQSARSSSTPVARTATHLNRDQLDLIAPQIEALIDIKAFAIGLRYNMGR